MDFRETWGYMATNTDRNFELCLLYMCMFVRTCVCVYVCTHVRMYVCLFICMCA
jgi:hypothetical protein